MEELEELDELTEELELELELELEDETELLELISPPQTPSLLQVPSLPGTELVYQFA